MNSKKWILKHLWWMNILYPLFFGMTLLALLSYLAFSGQKHRRLASDFEKKLIELSLNWAHRVSGAEPQPPTVAVKDIAEGTNPVEPLAAVLNQEPSLVYFFWLPSFLLYTDELLQVVKNSSSHVVFVVQPKDKMSMPDELRHFAAVKNGTLCMDGVQVLCVYNKRYDDWIVQGFWKDHKVDRFHVSKNLPTSNPSFLLRLPRLEDPISATNREVFLGPSAQTVKIAQSEHKLPLHHFMASVREMIARGDTVAVMPFRSQTALSIAVFLIIFILCSFSSSTLLMVGFIAAAFCLPFANALATGLFGAYLPLFNLYFAGSVAFLFATFIRLSTESYRHWRSEMMQRSQQEGTESKKNFISLLSHNINTPLAKIKGLFEVLSMNMPEAEKNAYIKTCAKDLTTSEVLVRYVLVLNALQEGNFEARPLTLKAILADICTELMPAFGKLGLTVSLRGGEDYAELPLHFDARVLLCFLSAQVVCAGDRVDWEVCIREREDGFCLESWVTGDGQGEESILTELGQDLLKAGREKRLGNSYPGGWVWYAG